MISGVLIIDKPLGPTSMQVVARVRHRAGRVKTGHAGTLDPLATGVLVLALGKATKMIERLMGTPKRYTTTIDLSAFTSTDDREGERSEVAVESPPDITTINQCLDNFTGEILQKPPAFSATKVNGQRAYKLARQGAAVDLPPRPVVIHDIQVLHYKWPALSIAIHCEKGTYIRSLARDIGQALGTGGHCSELRRTAVGAFTEEMAVTLEQLPEVVSMEHLLPVERVEELIASTENHGGSTDSN